VPDTMTALPPVLDAVGLAVAMGLQNALPDATVTYRGWDLLVDNRGRHVVLSPADWSVMWRAHVEIERFERVPTGLPKFALDPNQVVSRIAELVR
jgi:hypothetical protein